jgi:hypothetical protein
MSVLEVWFCCGHNVRWTRRRWLAGLTTLHRSRKAAASDVAVCARPTRQPYAIHTSFYTSKDLVYQLAYRKCLLARYCEYCIFDASHCRCELPVCFRMSMTDAAVMQSVAPAFSKDGETVTEACSMD